MTDKLKSCPFCGGAAEYLGPYIDEDGLKMHQVGCSSYPSCIGGCYAIGSTKEEAIELWNKRPNHWHTGTPTEEGWYLLATKNKNYVSYKATEIKSEAHLALVKEIIKPYKIVAWMPVPPFEASKERE